jgi:hypothetical protein
MVSPREEEMPEFLKVIAQGWRTPKRKWEDLWRLRRGELNHVLGMRQFGGPKYQRGSLSGGSVRRSAPAAGGTAPALSGVTQSESNVAPSASRVHLWYDSDGGLELHSSSALSPTYTALTTQSDDANDHTNEWWPDQPDTNEGLNWDIRYTNNSSSGVVTARYLFRTSGAVDRTVDVWYLLDTVSNDGGDTFTNGCLGVNRNNGVAKTPSTGNGNTDVDTEIRATGSGSAVASHAVFLEAIGT